MDRNLLLAFSLSMAVFLLWMVWQQEIHPPVEKSAGQVAEQTQPEPKQEPLSIDLLKPEPRASEKRERVRTTVADVPVEKTPVPENIPAWSGVLENSIVRVEFSNRGGVLTSWRMKEFYETPRHEVPIELIDIPDNIVPTLTTVFQDDQGNDPGEPFYQVESANSQQIVLYGRHGDLEVRKIYRQPGEDYEMEFDVEVINRGSASMDSSYSLIVPAAVNERPDFKELALVALAKDDVTRELVPSLGGGSFFGGLFGGDDGPFHSNADVGWAGIDLRYFAGVILPANQTDVGVSFVPIVEGKVGVARLDQHGPRLAPGEKILHRYSLFFGPKDPTLLRGLGRDLDKTINRGWSWVEPLTIFFEWALASVHKVVPNYGLVIIILTVLVRLVTLPIIGKQMKSSERMRDLMPQIKALQEKYKDDRQKQSEETFKLYREEGVNPLSGCLPLVLQMPVFIGLFYALQTSFELRQAPFIFWINDLSIPATLFTLPGLDFPVRILPIIMAGSMVLQTHMTPQTGMDPAQAKMMMIMMPAVMLLFSYTFPSGLVLYWTVSNLLGIGHQLWIRRRMHAKAEASAG